MKLSSILLTVAMLSGVAFAQAPITGLWALDASTGTIAADGSINGNHGTLVNFGATPWGPAVHGNGLTFDGIDDYVDCMTTSGLPLHGTGQPYTICGWVNGAAQADKRIYSEGSAFSNTPLFTIGSGSAQLDKIRIFIRNDTGAQWFRETTSPVFDGSWHHFAWICDGVSSAKMYVDGNLDATDFNNYLGGTFTTDVVSLGAVLRATVCCNMAGMLDDIRAYPFELTATDIGQVMSNATLGTGFQMNQAAASLNVNGFSGSVSSAARVTVAQGTTVTVNLASSLGGMPWEIATVSTPAIPNGLVLDPANIVNMPIGSATLINGFFSSTWGAPITIPGFTTGTFNVAAALDYTTPAATGVLTVQFGMADPTAPAGFRVSGAAEIDTL